MPRTLVGWGGFKGPPDADGAVEIGYAVAPAWEGRGVATAAVAELLREAWAAPGVRRVLAHTLAGGERLGTRAGEVGLRRATARTSTATSAACGAFASTERGSRV